LELKTEHQLHVLGNNDALVDALSCLSLSQDGPQHSADDVRRRVGRVEPSVKIRWKACLLVLDAARRVLDGKRPGQSHALVDVTQQTGAVTKPWEVVQRVPYTLTDFLIKQYSHRSTRRQSYMYMYITRRWTTAIYTASQTVHHTFAVPVHAQNSPIQQRSAFTSDCF